MAVGAVDREPASIGRLTLNMLLYAVLKSGD